MSKVTILLTAPKTLIGYLIRKVTWSDTSHVAIQVGDYIYEANLSRGVFRTHVDAWTERTVYRYNIPVKNPEIVKARLENELRKGYDIFAILCYPFKCDYNDKKRWICSELVSYAIQEYLPHTHFNRIAPRHLNLIGHSVSTSIKESKSDN